MSKTFMQKLMGAAAVLVIAAVPNLGAAEVQVTNEAFAITLPDGFTEFVKQAQTTEAAEGNIETTNWISKAPTGEAVVVTVSKMPGKILDPEKMMTSTRDSLLQSLNATLETEETIEGDAPATRFAFRSNTEAPVFLRSHLTVDDDRLYQLLYIGRSAEQRELPVIAQLFESFRIARETPAAASDQAALIQE